MNQNRKHIKLYRIEILSLVLGLVCGVFIALVFLTESSDTFLPRTDELDRRTSSTNVEYFDEIDNSEDSSEFSFLRNIPIQALAKDRRWPSASPKLVLSNEVCELFELTSSESDKINNLLMDLENSFIQLNKSLAFDKNDPRTQSVGLCLMIPALESTESQAFRNGFKESVIQSLENRSKKGNLFLQILTRELERHPIVRGFGEYSVKATIFDVFSSISVKEVTYSKTNQIICRHSCDYAQMPKRYSYLTIVEEP